MANLSQFLNSLKGKNIHLVGVTGAEGSSILNLLVSQGVDSLTVHDFSPKVQLEKNFKIWHKGLTVKERNQQFLQFKKNLDSLKFHDRATYLKTIENADLIFVPQSWRLYPQNKPLFNLKRKGSPFYSLMRLYLDYAPARIIAVTGTVGKGSVSNLVYEILKRFGECCYFAGNETWRLQLANEMRQMTSSSYLVLEVSHRQLLDGFSRPPFMTVFTNLYPNHLDELSFREYCKVKLSLVNSQKEDQYSILNYDDELLRSQSKMLKSKVVYFSAEDIKMNIKDVQKIYPLLLNNKSNHYLDNLLAVSTAVNLLGISAVKLGKIINDLPALPARLEKISVLGGVTVYDDIKSTTPWSTLKALNKISGSIVLIMGGKTKGISYHSLAEFLINKKVKTILMKSPLSRNLRHQFPHLPFKVEEDLVVAVIEGIKLAGVKGSLLISPAAADFYSSFIKGKRSIRKIITAL